MKRHLLILLFATLLSALSFAGATAAAIAQPQNYHRAFAALDAGHPDLALTYAEHGGDPILNKVLRSYYMAQPGNDVSFSELSTFINENPSWPNLNGIVSIAEQKLPTTMSAAKVIDWFTNHPAQTLVGFYRYVDAVLATGDNEVALHVVRSRWIESDFNHDDLQTFYTRYSDMINPETHGARLDRLLWKEDITNARIMYDFVTPDQRQIADARIALATRSRQAQTLLTELPTAGRRDPGLQWELLRWYVATKSDQNANQILLGATENLGRPGAWWDPRQTMIRRAIEDHDYQMAYRLARENGQTEGKDLLQAEFLAGWIALRFLNQPDDAERHFKIFLDNATTPVSKSRGSYWLGRTYEVLQDKEKAEQSYEDAAAFDTTYYGQLALTRIYANPTLEVKSEPPIPAKVRNAFYNNDIIQAVERLYYIGERDRSRIFFKAATDAANARVEFVLLSELAYKLKRPDLAIGAAKVANQKNFIMAASSFPMLRIHMPSLPEPAFINALIRQESMFNPEASSPVGAIGLMQLMPSTAKGIATKLGVKYKSTRMVEPDFNIQLGTAYVEQLINHFGGSYVLAAAAYNAGPSRVNEWLDTYGDPRTGSVDPIDWIELIPVSETRNYVQRILENLQCYRARIANGKVSLLILNDLKP